ncbi:hypothetical protein [Halalkalibacter akibai]|uniref:F0F1 ATP synthase subunit C n=1 Tax=Halalkalibacter akibai (strain ATCC 43226 / DSM 21942 / CIP 109018 / JCM 9157 / 1139) TaxID=1236973 RepID=W4QVQ0_HALA3|nr:hypothetical protein [Halalkalibacter akibai]GAE35957.1 hypothetical protein JCM9157_3100 [Halalkalibacter akibai JCM 9157]
MILPIWLFVLATVIAVVGIVFYFKKFMSDLQTKMDNNEEVTTTNIQKENSRFFVRVMLVEAVPIVLVVFGFMLFETVGVVRVMDVLPALIIIAVTFIAGVANIFLARGQLLSGRDVSSQAKAAILSMTFVGISLTAAFPIISFVAIMILFG